MIYLLRQPLGVVAGITPVQLPGMILTLEARPLLSPVATPSIPKPSELATLKSRMPCRISSRLAALPASFNVVNGDKQRSTPSSTTIIIKRRRLRRLDPRSPSTSTRVVKSNDNAAYR